MRYPELAPVLNRLAGQINDSIMTALNYQVEYLHRSPEKCAHDFLVSKGLYREPRNGNKGIIRIGSKIFPEQYILTEMYAELIRGYTDLQVDSKTGLGGTQICFEALINGHIDCFPVNEDENWERDPHSGDIADGFVYGRGGVDMKVGLN